jgi:hypothetical protein
MNPTSLMIEDTLRAADKEIATALRQLKDLEAPLFATSVGRSPGGQHRDNAMMLLRLALQAIHRAALSHLEESAFRARFGTALSATAGAGPSVAKAAS